MKADISALTYETKLPHHQPMEQLSLRAVKTSDLILNAPP